MTTMYRRKKPELIDIGNDHYDWEEAMARRARPSLIDHLALLFVPWKTVLAPDSMPAAITTLDRKPIYRYKEMGCCVYYLGPAPSPGFPGS